MKSEAVPATDGHRFAFADSLVAGGAPQLAGGAHLPGTIMTRAEILHRFGVLPGNNIISGPGFVTADGLELVGELAGEYR